MEVHDDKYVFQGLSKSASTKFERGGEHSRAVSTSVIPHHDRSRIAAQHDLDAGNRRTASSAAKDLMETDERSFSWKKRPTGALLPWLSSGSSFWVIVVVSIVFAIVLTQFSPDSPAFQVASGSRLAYNTFYMVGAFGVTWLTYAILLPGLPIGVLLATLLLALGSAMAATDFFARNGKGDTMLARTSLPVIALIFVAVTHFIWAAVLSCRRARAFEYARGRGVETPCDASFQYLKEYEQQNRTYLGPFTPRTSPYKVYGFACLTYSVLFACFFTCQWCVPAPAMPMFNSSTLTVTLTPLFSRLSQQYLSLASGELKVENSGIRQFMLFGALEVVTQACQSTLVVIGSAADEIRGAASCRMPKSSARSATQELVLSDALSVHEAVSVRGGTAFGGDRSWDHGGLEAVSYELFAEAHTQAFFNAFARGVFSSVESWETFIALQCALVIETAVVYPLRMSRPSFLLQLRAKTKALQVARWLAKHAGTSHMYASAHNAYADAALHLNKAQVQFALPCLNKSELLSTMFESGYDAYVLRLCIRFGTRILTYTVPAIGYPLLFVLIRQSTVAKDYFFFQDLTDGQFARLLWYSGISIVFDVLIWMLVTYLVHRMSGFHVMTPFAKLIGTARVRYVLVLSTILGHVLTDTVYAHAKLGP